MAMCWMGSVMTASAETSVEIKDECEMIVEASLGVYFWDEPIIEARRSMGSIDTRKGGKPRMPVQIGYHCLGSEPFYRDASCNRDVGRPTKKDRHGHAFTNPDYGLHRLGDEDDWDHEEKPWARTLDECTAAANMEKYYYPRISECSMFTFSPDASPDPDTPSCYCCKDLDVPGKTDEDENPPLFKPTTLDRRMESLRAAVIAPFERARLGGNPTPCSNAAANDVDAVHDNHRRRVVSKTKPRAAPRTIGALLISRSP